jgi:hypothetical protein
MTRRIFTAVAAATLLAMLWAGSALGGGWATITADTSNPTQPGAGEPFTFGFTVLQHGVTPAGWVGATFVGINGTTGERIEFKATNQGPDGHFVANVTLPSAGSWTWQVELTDLIVETGPQPMLVANADGTVPAMNSGEVLAALERTRNELEASFSDRLATQTEALQAEMQTLRTNITVLQAQRDGLKKQVDALTAARATEGPGSVPVFAIVGLAVLAGAISGFVMTALGRGGGPIRRPDGTMEEVAPTGALSTR